MTEKDKKLQFYAIEGVIPNKKNNEYKMHDIDVLAESIKQNGMLTPITVCYDPENSDEGYTILSGHRRYEAAKRLGLTEVPIRIVDCPKTTKEKIEVISQSNICRNSDEDMEASIKTAADLWDKMGAEEKHNFTVEFKERYIKTHGSSENFRPRDEYIRFQTGIANVSSRTITRQLNEPKVGDEETKETKPKEKKPKKMRTFTQFCDANVVELNHMLSEDNDEILPDEIIAKIQELKELMLPYTTKKHQEEPSWL